MSSRRTKKDVRRFGDRARIVEDDSRFDGVNFRKISDKRFKKFVEHGWIQADEKSLTLKGKAIIRRWESLEMPKDALNEEGAPKFISNAKDLYNPDEDEIEVETFNGIKIRNGTHEKVPTGYGGYYERDVRAGKTDVELVCRQLSVGNHVLLKGETGTGKTSVAHYIGQKTNRPTWQVNFSQETRIQHLLGHYEVHEENGGTEMEWIDGVLTKAVKEGGIFIADEINAADGGITMILHSVLEGDDATLTIPEKGETIEVHDDFRMIGTKNPRYAGTRQQNRALLNRFYELEIGYLPEGVELDIVYDNVALSKSLKGDMKDVIKLGHELRQDYLDGEISVPTTPRDFQRIAEFMKGGFMDKEDAVKAVMLEKMPPEDEAPVEKTIETTI